MKRLRLFALMAPLSLFIHTAAHAASVADRAQSLGLPNIWTTGRETTAICGCPYTTEWDGSNRRADIASCITDPHGETFHTDDVDFMPVTTRALTMRGFTVPTPARGIVPPRDILDDPAVYVPVLKDMMTVIGDKRYGHADGGDPALGQCPLLIDYRTGIVEPTGKARGVIGRILLYAGEVWKVPLTSSEKELFSTWSHDYPPDAAEQRRARDIARMTGIANPVVKQD